MLDRDYLVAGIDVSLCLLIVFAIGFLATRYDEVKGDQPDLTGLQVVHAGEGDFSSMAFLAVVLRPEGIWTQEFNAGNWLPKDANWPHVLANTNLPLVIYDFSADGSLGEVVRAAIDTGQPIAITKGDLGGYLPD